MQEHPFLEHYRKAVIMDDRLYETFKVDLIPIIKYDNSLYEKLVLTGRIVTVHILMLLTTIHRIRTGIKINASSLINRHVGSVKVDVNTENLLKEIEKDLSQTLKSLHTRPLAVLYDPKEHSWIDNEQSWLDDFPDWRSTRNQFYKK